MRITLINQYTGPLFIDVVNAFAKEMQVVLVTGSIQEGGKKIDPSVRIKRLSPYYRNSAFARFLTWSIFALQCFVYLLKTGTDHLFFVTNPPFAPFIGTLIHKIRKKPYSLLIYDLYPDILEQLGYLSRDSWIHRLWEKLNRASFRNAKNIFTISNHMASGIKKYIVDDIREVRVIPPWADNEFIKPMMKLENPFCIDNKIDKYFIVLYSGNMGLAHDLESMIHAAVSFKGELGIRFILVGDGAKKQSLVRLMENSNLENVLFLPFQPVNMLPYSLASGDIAVITLGKGAEMLSVPSKTYSMMAAGCALLIIADRKSEIARMALEYECGGVFEPGDVEGIIGFIQLMFTNRILLEKYKDNSRKASYFYTNANAFRFVEGYSGAVQ